MITSTAHGYLHKWASLNSQSRNFNTVQDIIGADENTNVCISDHEWMSYFQLIAFLYYIVCLVSDLFGLHCSISYCRSISPCASREWGIRDFSHLSEKTRYQIHYSAKSVRWVLTSLFTLHKHSNHQRSEVKQVGLNQKRERKHPTFCDQSPVNLRYEGQVLGEVVTG